VFLDCFVASVFVAVVALGAPLLADEMWAAHENQD
jgi:hypothetical protein